MFFIPLFNIKYSILVQNVKSKIYWRLLITDNISKSQSAASFICGVISFLATLVWYACYFLWIYGLFCLGDIFLMNNKLELWLKAVEVQNKMSHFLERLQIQEKIGSMWPAVKLGVFFLLCFKSYRWKNLKELSVPEVSVGREYEENHSSSVRLIKSFSLQDYPLNFPYRSAVIYL